ncbi:S8 family serine peptidase [bacterium]|nr:S8 family serine peptidase [bacterium]
MKKPSKHRVSALIIAACGLLGWWLGRDASPVVVRQRVVVPHAEPPVKSPPPRRLPQVVRDEFRDGTTVEMFASLKPDEVILRFPSEESYGTFLFALDSGRLHLVDQLDRLRAVRLGYDDWADLATLLDGENIIAYDSLPAVPTPSPAGGAGQSGLLGFGDGLLPWLGITSDHSRWGTGVRIAVLDSGVVPHPALTAALAGSIAITPYPSDLSKTNGHGTAVASLIAGNDPSARGVAPAAKLISIRVGDESGKADSFALAAGILAAVDAGVHLINCSMGTTENNPLIEDAVLYAQERDVMIVAAAGNSEQAEACYPAAYPSVISVGAVDARGEHLDFSNYGTFLSLTAPGYSIAAAWPGNRYTRISGTSASAPIVAGAIAATMSSGGGITMSARQAADLVMSHSDEAGIPGPDSEYGVGILNIGRIMSRGIPGIVDAAITHQRIVKSADPAANDEIQVTVQNRGTATLVNTLLEISTLVGSRQFNATTMAPGAIQTFSMSVRLNGFPQTAPIEVNSSLVLGTTGQDITPRNNRRSDTLDRR